jgi:hypothetical protein
LELRAPSASTDAWALRENALAAETTGEYETAMIETATTAVTATWTRMATMLTALAGMV